jgi:hypothetical protein
MRQVSGFRSQVTGRRFYDFRITISDFRITNNDFRFSNNDFRLPNMAVVICKLAEITLY